jgi:glycosyltransferase involved in cell wall biosynthesis
MMRGQTSAYSDYAPLIKHIVYLSDLLPGTLARKWKLPFFDFLSAYHLYMPLLARHLFKHFQVDVVIAHNTLAALLAVEIRRAYSIPVIIVLYDPLTYVLGKAYGHRLAGRALHALSVITRQLDRYYLANADHIALQSTVHLESVRRATHTPVSVLHIGCRPSSAIPAGRGEYVLFATRWSKAKRLDVPIAIASHFPDTRVVVVGQWVPPRLRTAFEAELRRRQLGNVEVIGAVDEEALAAFYRGARVWIGTIVEGFGLGGLEAAAQGCPVIMPRGSGVVDMFQEGAHGYFPSEGDIAAYVAATRVLLDDERLAHRLGTAAWTVSQRHSWHWHTERLLELARAVVSRCDVRS